jgi:hypothetical protein
MSASDSSGSPSLPASSTPWVGLPKPRSASQVAASRRSQLHPVDLAAEHADDEGDEVVAVACVLADRPDDALRTTTGIP